VIVVHRRQAAPGPAEPLQWREAARFGTEGEGPLSFGVIGDVAVGHQGEIYALDVLRKRVSALTPDGRALWRFGREGHGPGEFTDPVAVAAAEGGRLYVLDRANQRIEILRVTPATATRVDAIPLDFAAEDMCVSDGRRVFLLGARRGRLLHELDPSSGRIIRSFAHDTAAADLLMQSYRTSGYLLCAPGNELALLPLLRPEVQRFSAESGALLGTVKIPGYHAVRVRRLSDGSVQFYTKGGPHDYASSIALLPDGRPIVQVGRLRRGGSRHEFESLRSYEISWRDNVARGISSALPRIVTLHGDTAVTALTDPFAAVGILHLAGRTPRSHER
jgi:hypothetical protein